MKKDKTVCEAIKIVLKGQPEGMTAEQIYNAIIDNELYKFKARDPQGVVVATIRRCCVGIDNKSSISDKEFVIAREIGNEIYYALNNNTDKYKYADDNKITTDNEITNTWLLPYDPEKWDWIESGRHNDDLIKLKKEDKSFTIRWLATSEYSSVGDRFFISKIGNSNFAVKYCECILKIQ